MAQGSSHRVPHVVVLVDEGVNPFEVGVATEVFGLPRPELGARGPLYTLTLCTPEPDIRMNHGFFTMAGAAGLEAVDRADTLIVPGRPDNVVPRTGAVLEAIRRTHARGARIAAFCTGAFALAEAGLLDERRATTHWRWAEEFRALHPKVLLEPDVLFVDEGDVLTAAGSAAALDLGLYLVRRDHGAEVAASVSRRLVFAAHRDGGQRQFIERPVPVVPDASLAPVLGWAQGGSTNRSPSPDWPPAPPSARPPCTAASAPNSVRRRWPGCSVNVSPWPAGSSSAASSGSTSWRPGAAWAAPPICGRT